VQPREYEVDDRLRCADRQMVVAQDLHDLDGAELSVTEGGERRWAP
jgi:hypothetical protein